MRSGLLILPFLALLIGAVGTAVGSAYADASWLSTLGWATAAAVIILWVVLDLDGFKAVFARKGTKYGASSGLVVVLGVLVIIGLAVVSARPRFNKSFDVTRDNLNTLADQSQKIVEKIRGDGHTVKVTGYFTKSKVETEFRDLIQLYQAKGVDLQVDFVDPQTDPTRAMADEISSANTAIFRRGDQEKRITTFNEEKVTNALVNVLKEGNNKIYFTTGHGEGAIDGSEAEGYKKIVTELENNRFEVSKLPLLKTAKVPKDADAVVIAGPQYDFKKEELRILEDYMKKGGAVLAMVDAMVPVKNLNAFMQKFGLGYRSDFLILAPNDVRSQLLGQNSAIVNDFAEFSPVTEDFARQSQVALILRNTRSLEKREDNKHSMKVEVVGKTADVIIKVKDVDGPKDLENLNKDRWEMGVWPVMAVSRGKTNPPATAKNEGQGEAKSDVSSGGGAPGHEETRLVAVGSSSFASNAGIQQAAENRDMFMNIANYLLQDEDFISIRPKDPTKSTIDLSSQASQLTLLLLAFVYPFVFLGSGTVYWFIRRRA